MRRSPHDITIATRHAAGMGKVSKASAANTVLQGPVEDHNEDVHGYTINFLTFITEPWLGSSVAFSFAACAFLGSSI